MTPAPPVRHGRPGPRDTLRADRSLTLAVAAVVLLALTPAVTYARLGAGGISVNDLPPLAAIILGALALLLRGRARGAAWLGRGSDAVVRVPAAAWLLAGFAVAAGVSALSAARRSAPPPGVTRALLSGRLHMLLAGPARGAELVVLVLVAYNLGRDARVRRVAVRALVVVAAGEAVFGLVCEAASWTGPAKLGLQPIGIQPFRSYQSLYKVLPGRISGTLGLSADGAGALFALALAPAVGLALSARARARLVWAAAALLVGAGLLFTFTRVAIVVGVLAAVVLLAVRARPRVTLATLAALAVVAVATPVRTRFLNDKNDRAALWSAAWRMTRDHAWTGVGPDNYGAYLARYSHTAHGLATSTAHDFVLQAAATMGVVAAALLLAAVVASLWWGGRAISARRGSPAALAMWLGLACFALDSLTVNTLFWPQLALVFWSYSALFAAPDGDADRWTGSAGATPGADRRLTGAAA